MADRENVPYAGEVQPRSDIDDDNAETAYPISTFQHRQFNTTAYNSDPEDEYDRFRARRNERDPLCHIPDFDGGENEDCDSDISENVLQSSENGNRNSGLIDCIEHLGLSDDDDFDTTKKDDEKDTISEDEIPEEVEREDTEESDDDTTEERNTLVRFLELSNLFFRNIMRKAYDFSKRTPRK